VGRAGAAQCQLRIGCGRQRPACEVPACIIEPVYLPGPSWRKPSHPVLPPGTHIQGWLLYYCAWPAIPGPALSSCLSKATTTRPFSLLDFTARESSLVTEDHPQQLCHFAHYAFARQASSFGQELLDTKLRIASDISECDSVPVSPSRVRRSILLSIRLFLGNGNDHHRQPWLPAASTHPRVAPCMPPEAALTHGCAA
jgi:hypothetical protein